MDGSNRLKQYLFLVIFLIFIGGCGYESPVPSVTIDLSDAEVLFTAALSDEALSFTLQKTTSEDALSYLNKITSSGEILPVIYDVQGKTVVSDIEPTSVFVGPDNKVYLTFSGEGRGGVILNGKGCYLIRGTVDGSTECYGPEDGRTPTGEELALLNSFNPHGYEGSINLSRIASHFDEEINFYFVREEVVDGNDTDTWWFYTLSPDGIVSERLALMEVELENFAIGNDGTIFFSGYTTATGRWFLRRTVGEGVEDLALATYNSSDFIIASSNDIFVLGSTGVYQGVNMDESISFNEVDLPAIPNSISNLRSHNPLGSVRANIYSTSDGSLFEDTFGNVYYEKGRIIRIYPGEPAYVTENSVTLAKTSSSFLYYSGTDSTNSHIFRRVDITNETFPEEDLLGGENIEVYRFQVWADGDILFGGYRLSDNQLILGQIDGETLELSVTATANTRVDALVLIE